MAYGFSWAFASSYTQLRDLIATKIAAEGWVEQGSTMVFKSPAADSQGNYAYVHVTDDGVSKPKLSCSISMDDAGTALAVPISRTSEVNNWPKMWHFYIYDKWFYCFETSLVLNDVDAFLGAGLFKPLPGSVFWANPAWVYAGNGTDPGSWVMASGNYSLSGRVRLPDGVEVAAGPIALSGSNVAGDSVSPMGMQGQLGGGLFVQPCALWLPGSTTYSVIGSVYNSIFICGIGWEAVDGTEIASHSLLSYGSSRVYMVPARIQCHQGLVHTGMSVAFQVDGFE